MKIKKEVRDYIECALWTSEFDDRDTSHFNYMTTAEVTKDLLEFDNLCIKADIDLVAVQRKHPELSIGHDLWLSRNGHGAGFWDRGLGNVGEKLSAIAQSMEPKELELGDNGQFYFI